MWRSTEESPRRRTAGPWRRVAAPLCLLAAGALAAAPLRADWLVTRDGARVETKGAWTVKGKLVVFTLPAGTLSSLRLDAVDLEASERATAEALAPPPAAPAPEAAPASAAAEKQPPRRVLTDKDFGHREEPAAAPADGQAPAAETPAAGLEVMNWNQVVDPNRNTIEVSGTLRNGGGDFASALSLEVQLVDRAGAVLATKQAALSALALPSGDSTRFQVVFPGGIPFDTVKFDVHSVALKARPAAMPAPGDAATPAEAPPPPPGG